METTSRSQTISILPIDFKKHSNLSQKCPICNKKIQFGVEFGFLENAKRYPYPHMILHGNPLHALIVYIDADLRIRGIETAQSIEIQKNVEIFS